MKATETPLKDCYIIEPEILGDDRGYFFESFSAHKLLKHTGIKMEIVQENQSRSFKGVLRGMHFQIGEASQAKIVRTLQGEVLDVIIDLRKSSPTYGQHHIEVLSETNKKQIYVPKGFAHGFQILSAEAEFFYCVDRPYTPELERGILHNDPAFKIDWKVKPEELVISKRDKSWPLYNHNQPYFG